MNERDVDRHIGEKIKGRRRLLGMTQQSLANALGLSDRQVQHFECGRRQISASYLYMIARTLGVPVGHFYNGLGDGPLGSDVVEVGIVGEELALRILDLVESIAASRTSSTTSG